jgi:hypothetical protein
LVETCLRVGVIGTPKVLAADHSSAKGPFPFIEPMMALRVRDLSAAIGSTKPLVRGSH